MRQQVGRRASQMGRQNFGLGKGHAPFAAFQMFDLLAADSGQFGELVLGQTAQAAQFLETVRRCAARGARPLAGLCFG